jgi:hypothetical protein
MKPKAEFEFHPGSGALRFFLSCSFAAAWELVNRHATLMSRTAGLPARTATLAPRTSEDKFASSGSTDPAPYPQNSNEHAGLEPVVLIVEVAHERERANSIRPRGRPC